MAPSKKQESRKAQKAASKEVVDDAPAPSGHEFLEVAKNSVMGACIVTMAPMLRDFILELKENKGKLAPPKQQKLEKVQQSGEEVNTEATEGDQATDDDEILEIPVASELETPPEQFDLLKERLPWHNALGMAQAPEQETSMQAWLTLKGLEVDFGPRRSKRGNPGFERVQKNVTDFFPQYVHVVFALMLVRAFLGRSFFAFLPWVFGLQVASLMVPLDQVPEEKCPKKIREVAPLFLNALVCLLFLWEMVYKTYMLEKPLYIALIAAHAYVVKPIEK